LSHNSHSDIIAIIKYSIGGDNMARRPRKISGSGLYHVMLRGINKQTIFEADDDKYQLLSTLKRFVDAKKFILYGYCLMDNHVHLLIQELEDDISTAIKRISSSYVLWYNKKYERCGHLFQERFKSEAVETDSYFMIALRYIHQNPIEARICKVLLDYKWTSYREYIKEPIIIDSELCLNLFSPNKDRAIDLFVEYMNQNNEYVFTVFEEYVKLTDSEVLKKYMIWGLRT
jgi:putative transposase